MPRHEHSNPPPAALTHHPLIAEIVDRLRVLAAGQLVGTRRGPEAADAVQLLHLIGRHISEAKASDEARPGVVLHPILEHALETFMAGEVAAVGAAGGVRRAVDPAPLALAAGEGVRHG